jgi:hypothetical protein
LHGSGIDAEMIVRGIANPGFRRDCAIEMIVKIGAFGHLQEQVAEFERAVADGVERERGAPFKRS